MSIKRLTLTILVFAVGALALAVPTLVAAAPKTASVTIRHQVRGCHAWSVNGGPFAASHTISVARGGSIRFTNDDVMPHKLVKLSGPAAKFLGRTNMSHMNATLRVTFPKAGVYTFTTRAGEDYMSGVKTTGEDNVLRLKVSVS